MATGDPQSRIEGTRRTIALDIRSWKLGFVVLDGLSLIDWGVRRFRTGTGYSATDAEKKLGALLGFYRPTTIVLRFRPAHSKPHTPRRAKLLRTLKALAAQYSAHVEFVGVKDIRSFFAPYGGTTTKHGISTTLAEWFGELSRSLPPKRKAWESEHHNAVIFDAAAAAMTFLALKSEAVSMAPQLGE